MTNTERDEKELTEAFDSWFHDLMFMEGQTCLFRDVLRASKKTLKEHFMQIKPVYTTSELDEATERAKVLQKGLFGKED